MITLITHAIMALSSTPLPHPVPPILEGGQQTALGGIPIERSDKLAQSVVSLKIIKEIEGRLYRARCSGAIISKHAVLTAAHCVSGNIKEIKVLIYRRSIPSYSFEADSWEIHPDYENPDLKIDLGMIFLNDPIKGFAKALPLTSDLPIEKETELTLVGSGRTSDHKRRGANKSLEMNRQRGWVFKHGLNGLNRSVVFHPPKKFMCQGDSGGPALIKKGKRWILWGVIQGGLSMDETKCENTLTIVSHLGSDLNWVKDTLANFLSQRQ